MVRRGRIELPQLYSHKILSLARLPIPPPPQNRKYYTVYRGNVKGKGKEIGPWTTVWIFPSPTDLSAVKTFQWLLYADGAS